MLTRRSFGSIGFVSLISPRLPCQRSSASRAFDVARRPSASDGPPSHHRLRRGANGRHPHAPNAANYDES